MEDLLAKDGGLQMAMPVLMQLAAARQGDRYLHWDELRHRTPPQGLSHEQWWLAEKLARRSTGTPLPLLSCDGSPFWLCQPPMLLQALHDIDRRAGAGGMAPSAVTTPSTRNRYLLSALMEEAITSSQMEGAATTRDVAKAMIRSRRAPRDRSEQMILNNFRTMQHIRELKDQPLTPQLVLDLHQLVSQDTLDDPADAGRLRPLGEEVVVDDAYGTVFHVPPPAAQLEQRLEQLCAFANGETPAAFLHPVVRAITLHFALAYDHPFCDGNGRTARALFYWAMLHQGYGLFEFLSISSVINKARGQYERSFLLSESDDNDLTYFLLAQVKVIQQAITSLHAYLRRKACEVGALQRQLEGADGFEDLNGRQLALLRHGLRHPGFRYTVLSHQSSHGVSNQTARSDLQKLAGRGLLIAAKEGKREIFRVPADLAACSSTISCEGLRSSLRGEGATGIRTR
ncbi:MULTISPECIES: Fic family protein [unclassified Cyanobium]|jgi:Fic family protein|uniref:Fic family protein n=1 Tax=unclassified Cyanobium TaxID=2627006 RepID=UPI0020CCF787|nr:MULTISPECIES: Fic family protein [unclassified Cyanobium]